jgi:hypothetical protein
MAYYMLKYDFDRYFVSVFLFVYKKLKKVKLMILCINIGNTNIRIGIYDEKIILKFDISSDTNRTSDEYSLIIDHLLTLNGLSKNKINGCVISSVVPLLSSVIAVSIKKLFLSYCHSDSFIANIIEENLNKQTKRRISISRDIRDIQYKDNIEKFMQTIEQHDFTITIISDKYLK